MKEKTDRSKGVGDPSNAKTNTEEDTAVATSADEQPREIGGRDGPDPTRYGDWEKNGRCIDF